MKAAYIHEPCLAEEIHYGDLPDPTISPTQCLVRVGAASVNPVDTYVRSGKVTMSLPDPYIIGCDLAGTVEKVGSKVSEFKPGDRVWGTNQGLLGRQGTSAELAAVEECWLYHTPDRARDEEVAALSLVAITAHLGLVREVQLLTGETIFVQGGTGGVGSSVIQMAKALGARIITTAGTEQKAEKCLQLGADEVIQYKTESVAERLKSLAPAGVNVWWETLREPDFDLAIESLAARGRMVVMAGREARPPFPVGPFYVKGCSLHGFVMFLATPDEQRACAEDINDWIEEGLLVANIDQELPLSAAARAHQLQEDNTIHHRGTLSGKIILKPDC